MTDLWITGEDQSDQHGLTGRANQRFTIRTLEGQAAKSSIQVKVFSREGRWNGGDLGRAATPCGGRLTGRGVAEQRAVDDADIITARYTDGGHAPADATARQPENCTCRNSWAPCGRRRRRPAAVSGFR